MDRGGGSAIAGWRVGLDGGEWFEEIVGVFEDLAGHIEFVPQQTGGGRAFLGIFGEHASDQVFEIGALEFWTQRADGFGDLLEDTDKLFNGRTALDGEDACEGAIPDDADRVDICCTGDFGFFFELFWGEVAWSSDDGSCGGELGFVGLELDLCDSEIKEFEVRKRLSRKKEKIRGFEIAVDNPCIVGMLESFAELARDGEQPRERKDGHFLEDLLEVLSLEEFKGHIIADVGILAKVKDGGDMGMREFLHGLSFTTKALDGLEVLVEVRFQEFEGGLGRVCGVLGFKDNGHPALSDALE